MLLLLQRDEDVVRYLGHQAGLTTRHFMEMTYVIGAGRSRFLVQARFICVLRCSFRGIQPLVHSKCYCREHCFVLVLFFKYGLLYTADVLQNNNNRELIERFQKLKALYK